ncbi:MAG: YdeI/OmpD-associated family protein [Acidobacteriota bacterium]
MITKNTLEFTRASDWRRWLERNHENEREVWLVFYKKHTGKNTFRYAEALDEALCFGWIDGILRRLDDDRYIQRFTPRRQGSSWSAVNIKKAERLVAEGRMREAGLVRFREAVQPAPRPRAGEVAMPRYIRDALRGDAKALENFKKLSPSQRSLYIRWVDAAKRAETRSRRLSEALSILRQGKPLGMK